jgi:hypothetical protein
VRDTPVEIDCLTSNVCSGNNSAAAIDGDPDIVQTINDQSRSSSSLNVALRPASVFAGKTFHHRKLIAADALVLTLLNKVEDGVGGKWQDKMHSLEGRACENCTLYPPHGEISRSRVYEFSFTPLSFKENTALAFAYGCMAIYVLLSLRRLKAFHSRFGLVVTAITQITTSIVASFTICGMLKINLATIPQNAYPFIVLIIGIENMFRLINAILAYPPTMATDLRIANALGDVGPLSIATAAQNLIILWLLSTIVSPGVKAFCAYAIIATLFDSFFLLTFFVAVLNVDIRRLELQDSIARSNQATQNKRTAPTQRTWFDALMHGRVPFSTRMAGSAVTTTFILSLNYHFFERKETVMKLRHLLGFVVGHGDDDLTEYESFAAPPMNATLTPGEWIRMQDFDTAREVMRLVKPGAHNLVIRIFSPLIVVLSGADRTGVPQGMDAVASALRGFALHHFYPFAVVVVFVVAFVAVLMNFLLWNETPDAAAEAAERAEDGLSALHIELPHRLDIVRITSSPKGHFATIGLDRSVAVSVYDRAQAMYLVDNLTLELNGALTWPLRNISIDEAGELLAFHCANDDVIIFSRVSRAFLACSIRYPDDHPAILFTFENLQTPNGLQQHFVLLTSGGRSVTMCLDDTLAPVTAPLSDLPLLGASIISSNGQGKQLYAVSEDTRLSCFGFSDSMWTQTPSAETAHATHLPSVSGAVSIESLPESGHELLTVSSASHVHIVDALTLLTIASVSTTTTNGTQNSSFLSGQRTTCDACGGMALQGFAIASSTPKGQDMALQLRSSERNSNTEAGNSINAFCVRNQNAACNPINDASLTTTHTISNPGMWYALPSHAVLGVRKRPVLTLPPRSTTPPKQQHLRHRRSARSQHALPAMPAAPTTSEEEDQWEAYSFSLTTGDLKTLDLCPTEATATTSGEVVQNQQTKLYITRPGPTALLDSLSVAVALGNNVKVLRITAPKGLGGQQVQGNGHGGSELSGGSMRLSNAATSRRRGTGSGGGNNGGGFGTVAGRGRHNSQTGG